MPAADLCRSSPLQHPRDEVAPLRNALIHELLVEVRPGAPCSSDALRVAPGQHAHGVSGRLDREVFRPPEELVTPCVANPVEPEHNALADLERLSFEPQFHLTLHVREE